VEFYLTRTMVSLTRGVGSNAPCTVCLVQKDRMLDLSESFTLRTTVATQVLLREVRNLNPTRKENRLKAAGLRDVEVRWLLIILEYIASSHTM
jgi:hypothetical protein